MKPRLLFAITLLYATAASGVFAEDVERSEPFTAAELESIYNANIEKRANAILEVLQITDQAKAGRVRETILVQYRSLKDRDEALSDMFRALSQNAPGIESNRPAVLVILSKQLHDRFLTRLAADLTPAQIETVKDRMTYNKVQVTYDAYCDIVPGLSDQEKAKILELLKAAREVALDGGSADEKTAIFQTYKDQINAMLDANGHDVAKATKAWEAKRAAAK